MQKNNNELLEAEKLMRSLITGGFYAILENSKDDGGKNECHIVFHYYFP